MDLTQLNFTASWRGSQVLPKNIKGGLGDFTFMLIGIPPPTPLSKKMNAPLEDQIAVLDKRLGLGSLFYVSLRRRVRKTFYDLFCPYF